MAVEPTEPMTLSFTEVGREDRSRVGGKVASLGELLRAGCQVPPGFALTSAAFAHFVEANGLNRLLEGTLQGLDPSDLDTIDRAAQEIQRAFLAAPIPAELTRAVEERYRQLAEQSGQREPAVAVRSSAVAEDSESASFAGQHETFLWVTGVESVLDAVRRCWASAFTPRAISYRMHQGISPHEGGLAVGVQRMVDPRAAGVMFTLSPRSGDPSVIVIEASWGVGVAVVGGEVTPDEYWVNKVTGEITRRHVATKLHRYVAEGSAGTLRKVEVPADMQSRSCLSDEEILALAEVGRRLERHYGHALDIEWAVDDSAPAPQNLYVLQARPETVWSQRSREPVVKHFTDPLSFIVQKLAGG